MAPRRRPAPHSEVGPDDGGGTLVRGEHPQVIEEERRAACRRSWPARRSRATTEAATMNQALHTEKTPTGNRRDSPAPPAEGGPCGDSLATRAGGTPGLAHELRLRE